MKILALFCLTTFLHAQGEFGPWERYVNETIGFSILSSSNFIKSSTPEILNADTLWIDTYSYSEFFKGDEVLSYITTYSMQLPADMDEDFSKDILYTSLEELSLSTKSEVVYENFRRVHGYDEIFFRMESANGRALKGKFVLSADRFYLVAMYYLPHSRLNKRANYFIESFTLMNKDLGRDLD